MKRSWPEVEMGSVLEIFVYSIISCRDIKSITLLM